LGGDENSGNILRMLYEGLMRIGADGVPTYGIAQSVNISSNFKQYIFKLRNADWSNGMRISAYDFEYAWKKILSPHFKTTFAYLFYPIKNAKLAKKGLLPLDAVGVKAVDHKTLKVDLETPTPYFLELTAHTIYSPINQTIDQSYPDWPMLDSESYVCNGPFQIEKHSPGHGYELRRNENYWEKDTVKLSKISVFKTTPYTAAKMYQKHEIDWIGAPLRPWESFFSHCQTQDPIQISTVSRALYWYAINTTLFPFNNLKVRQALAYAINRKKIIDTLLYDGLPALTPLPLIHTLNQQIKSLDQNEKKAEELFKEALQELGLQKDQFPVFTLIHINREMKRKVAKLIQQQWKEVLGIHCRLECYEWKELFLKMTQGDYQVGGMSWAARIDDPLYTLDVFADMENQFNFTKWEHIEFAKSLKKARKEICPKQQLQFLAQAERILTEQFPVIPLFYELERYKRKDYLKNVQLSRVGNIDFKSAYIFKDLKKVDY
jgi:oligopeptide transport system substrate-binding protein